MVAPTMTQLTSVANLIIQEKIAIFYEDNTYESITIDNVDSSEKIVYLENDPVQKSEPVLSR